MPLILGTNSIKDTGFNVANSLRFNRASSDYLSQTISSSTGKTFTLSFWMKKSTEESNMGIFHLSSDNNGSHYIEIATKSSHGLDIQFLNGSSSTFLRRRTNRLLRDFSAWMNVVIRFDSTQASASNRFRLYINGVQETDIDVDSTPDVPQDYVTDLNTNGSVLNIGRNVTNNHYYHGYLCEYVLVDGSSLDPTSFGEFDSDTNIWKPIDVSDLTFGTNGFYLDFENSSSLGADVSGQGNNFTVNNLTSIDQTTDTCTNNFITWSPLTPRSSDITLTQGNCDVTMGGTSRGIFATIGVSSGKWYYESKWVSGSFFQTGIVATDKMNDNDDVYGGKTGAFMYKQDGNIRSGGSTLASLSSLSTGDIVGVYLDLDNSKLYFAKNGTIQNSGTGIDISAYSEYTFACAPTSAVLSGNFGNPTFSISSGNTDPEGYGNFEYSTNDGGSASFDSSAKNFYALNTKNLAEYG